MQYSLFSSTSRSLSISLSEGKFTFEGEDFVDECLSDDDSFSFEDWVDAFEWISVSLTCEKC